MHGEHLVKDENGGLLVDSCSIAEKWKTKLQNIHIAEEFRSPKYTMLSC
jgi:hypothetical protein